MAPAYLLADGRIVSPRPSSPRGLLPTPFKKCSFLCFIFVFVFPQSVVICRAAEWFQQTANAMRDARGCRIPPFAATSLINDRLQSELRKHATISPKQWNEMLLKAFQSTPYKLQNSIAELISSVRKAKSATFFFQRRVWSRERNLDFQVTQ